MREVASECWDTHMCLNEREGTSTSCESINGGMLRVGARGGNRRSKHLQINLG